MSAVTSGTSKKSMITIESGAAVSVIPRGLVMFPAMPPQTGEEVFVTSDGQKRAMNMSENKVDMFRVAHLPQGEQGLIFATISADEGAGEEDIDVTPFWGDRMRARRASEARKAARRLRTECRVRGSRCAIRKIRQERGLAPRVARDPGETSAQEISAHRKIWSGA